MSDPVLGSFEEQVMLAVVRTAEDAYGMAVWREIESVTNRDVAIGAVYATLDRLEAKGMVESARTPESGPRKIFRVTDAGTAALAETRDIRERLWTGVELRPLAR